MAVDILDIPIYDKPLSDAVTEVLDRCLAQKSDPNLLISATSAHGLVTAQQDSQFRDVLREFFLNLPDGIPLVWVGRFKGARNMQRCYGPDFFTAVIKQSAQHEIRHFFCGGKEGVADELALVCEKKFRNSRCVGTFAPPFREMSKAEFLALGKVIKESGAEIVWIGMSTPKQEIFAKQLAEFVSVRFIITVGAAFDFVTGRVNQAPHWVQQFGLEWLFRLVMEPRRLFTRYLEVVPLFMIYALRDVLSISRR